MNPRVFATIPLLLATGLFTHVTGTPAVAPIVVIGALTAIAVAPRLEVSIFVQRMTLLVVAVLGALVGGALLVNAPGIGPTGLASFWGTIAMTALFLGLSRRFFRKAEGGEKADFALVSVAFVACGEKHTGTVYTVFVVLFVASIIVSLRTRDGGSWLVEKKARFSLGIIVLLGAMLTVLSLAALPRIEEFTQHQLEHVIFAGESKTGFTDRVRLGAADKILESDELVMRVYGPHTDYLRGQVFDRFDQGSWETTGDTEAHETTTVVGRPEGEGIVELRAVNESTERRPRFFLPLGAHRIGTTRGFAMADAMGTLRPLAGDAPTPLFFELNGPADLPVSAPTDEDLRVPDDLRDVLVPLVTEWTRGAETPKQKLLAIERRLSHDFRYSLEHDYPKKRDEPFIVHFLLHSRSGHCEYFATAMALLGRTAGVPTRIVGGYRVSEHNTLGGYDVVREKNAHAWVEGWIEKEGWKTFEPTPVILANQSHESHILGALTDAVVSAWERALDLIARASLWQFLCLLGGAIALLTVVRWLRSKNARPADGADAGSPLPLPGFAKLEAALGRRGHVRATSEPLEQYAERLKQANLEDAAELVLSYGAHRYGGIGEPSVLVARLDRYITQLASIPPK